MSRNVDTFVRRFARGAEMAAQVFGYPRPTDTAVAGWLVRLPQSTRELIGEGYERGLIRPAPTEDLFLIADATTGKGPYAWFSRNRGPAIPSPNWEYFFQVAEYVRIRTAVPTAFEVAIEDGLLDVSVRRSGDLLWYIEVKVRPSQIQPLVARLREIGQRVELSAPDRGNDPLRKAKYLVRHRPPHFSIVGGEVRRHFDVRYVGDASFELDDRDDGPEAAFA